MFVIKITTKRKTTILPIKSNNVEKLVLYLADSFKEATKGLKVEKIEILHSEVEQR